MSTPTPPPQTAAKDRLPVSEKVSFASGAFTFGMIYMGMAHLAYPIFNITLGISATTIGIVLAIGRLWDAVTDPLMGSISDNSRLRWGRRRPFILLGSLLCALAFIFMFWVPSDWSERAIFIWFVFSIFFLYTASTVFSVPWLSLSYELTPDSNERTRLHAYRAYAGIGASLLLPWLFSWAQSGAFDDTMVGMRWLSVGVAVAMILTALPVFFGCKERYAKKAATQAKIGVFKALGTTLHNRNFLILVLGVVTTMLCAPMLVGSLAIYVNSYYVYQGDTAAGAMITAQAAMVFTAIKFIILPIGVKLATRYGKRAVMRGALIIGFFAAISQFFFYTPALPQMQFLTMLLMAPSMTCFWLLVDPMKADCADYDEWKTGMRREGTYAAVANWIEKLCITVVLAFSGYLIDASGFDPALGGEQPEGTMFTLRLLFAVAPAIASIVALISLQFYTLGEGRMLEIRKELEARRGEINA
jgi:GPH family glycoside/pentoside/hexuronide:cation symporter